MVSQVVPVAILMIVQGTLSLLAALAYIGMAAVIAAGSGPFAGRRGDDAIAAAIFTAIYVGFGLLILVVGLLNVFGGIQALKFRNRGLVLAAVFSNIVVLPTCYCIPSGLTVLIYGAIVFFNRDVAEAFRLGEEGMTPEKIRARFDPWRGRVNRDDDD